MSRHHRLVQVPDGCVYDSSSSEDYTHIRVPRHSRHGSVVSSSHRHHHVHEPPYSASSLAVPVVDVGGRPRASSMSGLPQPNINIINAGRSSPSRSRSRSHDRSRDRSREGSRERVRLPSRTRGRRYVEEELYYDDILARRGRTSRTPSPHHHYDYETRKALERLKELERKDAEEAAQKRYKAEIELKRAKEQLEKAEAEEKRKAEAKKAVEEWKRAEEEKKARAKKEEEEVNKKVEERLRAVYAKRGYSEAEIEWELDNQRKKDKTHDNEQSLQRLRPTYIKVHTKHLLPETLDAYGLSWSWEAEDKEYVLIREEVSVDLQDQLFEHTRKIRSRRLIEGPIDRTTILKVNDKKKDKMYLVRKKDSSPMRIVSFRH